MDSGNAPVFYNHLLGNLYFLKLLLLFMPHKHGPNTYHGYESPPHGNISPHEAHILKVVYGTCREQHPGENPANKELCARIAWAAAKRE